MKTITIIGAGMMGSALAFPLTDNGHIVRLVGTHLDEAIIASIQAGGFHPTLKFRMPKNVTAFQFKELDKAL
jgi:glycerol-3-phosphate dehydrogenase (NAD(P)+)